MTTPTQTIDVAFSFLASEQPAAESLADAIRSHVRPFVYSEAQKELAGKDGVAEFTRIYGAAAALVVVLYRTGYGTTKWTRVEESAITSSSVERGWASVLVVSMDGSKPTWIPASRLWLGHDAYGAAATAEVIIARHEETGQVARPETALERAVSVSDRSEAVKKAQMMEGTGQGVRVALGGVAGLWSYLEAQALALQEKASSLGARFSSERDVRAFTIDGERVTFGWHQAYANVLEDSTLLVRELSWPKTRSYGDNPKWKEVKEELWLPKIAPYTDALAWQRHRGDRRLLTTQELAEFYLLRLVERHKARSE